MQISLLHLHLNHQLGAEMVAGKQRRVMRLVTQLRPAIDAQGFIKAGHHEEQAQARVVQQIAQAVEPVVAARVGDEQGACICRFDKTRLAATRRGIQQGAVVPARGQHHIGRQGDKAQAVTVQLGLLLEQGAFCGRCIELPQLVMRGNHSSSCR